MIGPAPVFHHFSREYPFAGSNDGTSMRMPVPKNSCWRTHRRRRAKKISAGTMRTEVVCIFVQSPKATTSSQVSCFRFREISMAPLVRPTSGELQSAAKIDVVIQHRRWESQIELYFDNALSETHVTLGWRRYRTSVNNGKSARILSRKNEWATELLCA